MELRQRLETQAETPLSVESAIADRYYAALELVVAAETGNGAADSAIYLLGYVAEMILKVAYFRVLSATDGTVILLTPTANLLALARQVGLYAVPQIRHESYHSVLFWATILRYQRAQQGRDFPSPFAATFDACCARIYSHWWIEMRYHRNEATLPELDVSYEEVSWLFDNREALWR